MDSVLPFLLRVISARPPRRRTPPRPDQAALPSARRTVVAHVRRIIRLHPPDPQHALNGGRVRERGCHVTRRPFGRRTRSARGRNLDALRLQRLQVTPRAQPVVAGRRRRHRPTAPALPLRIPTRRTRAAAARASRHPLAVHAPVSAPEPAYRTTWPVRYDVSRTRPHAAHTSAWQSPVERSGSNRHQCPFPRRGHDGVVSFCSTISCRRAVTRRRRRDRPGRRAAPDAPPPRKAPAAAAPRPPRPASPRGTRRRRPPRSRTDRDRDRECASDVQASCQAAAAVPARSQPFGDAGMCPDSDATDRDREFIPSRRRTTDS